MERIFNFLRSTNQQYVYNGNKILELTVVNSNGLVTTLQVLSSSLAAEIISSALVEFSERSENVYKCHQLLHVRSGNIINHNSSMEATGVVDNGNTLQSKMSSMFY